MNYIRSRYADAFKDEPPKIGTKLGFKEPGDLAKGEISRRVRETLRFANYSLRVSSPALARPAWWNVNGPSKMWSRYVDGAIQ